MAVTHPGRIWQEKAAQRTYQADGRTFQLHVRDIHSCTLEKWKLVCRHRIITIDIFSSSTPFTSSFTLSTFQVHPSRFARTGSSHPFRVLGSLSMKSAPICRLLTLCGLQPGTPRLVPHSAGGQLGNHQAKAPASDTGNENYTACTNSPKPPCPARQGSTMDDTMAELERRLL